MQPEPYTILLVDDDADYRRGMIRILRLVLERVNILEAGNGADAIGILTKEQVDFVFLDYTMPGGDGLAWLEHMLAVDRDIAVILLTGEQSKEIAEKALAKGAVDCLDKTSLSPTVLRDFVSGRLKSAAQRCKR